MTTPIPSSVGEIENCLPRATEPSRTAVLGGTTSDGAEWVTAFGIDDHDIQMVCVDITVAGAAAATGVLGGPFRAGSEPGEVVVSVSVLVTKPRGGPQWHVVRGAVTADADRLGLAIDGSPPVEALIADVGPQDGWRWYGLVVPAPEAGIPHVVATAYDADDDVVATGESPS